MGNFAGILDFLYLLMLAAAVALTWLIATSLTDRFLTHLNGRRHRWNKIRNFQHVGKYMRMAR